MNAQVSIVNEMSNDGNTNDVHEEDPAGQVNNGCRSTVGWQLGNFADSAHCCAASR